MKIKELKKALKEYCKENDSREFKNHWRDIVMSSKLKYGDEHIQVTRKFTVKDRNFLDLDFALDALKEVIQNEYAYSTWETFHQISIWPMIDFKKSSMDFDVEKVIDIDRCPIRIMSKILTPEVRDKYFEIRTEAPRSFWVSKR